MSGQPTLSITPAQFAALTPESQTQLEATLSKSGFGSEQIAALKAPAGGNKSVAPAKSAVENLIQPFTTNGKPQNTDPALRPPATAAGNIPYDQKVSAFQKLRDAGVADATLRKAAAEEGIEWSVITTEAPTEPPQNMGVNEANEKLAATSGPFAAGSDPSDYSFQFESRHLDGLDENEVAEIHSMFANGLHEGGVPLSLGQAVARDAVEAANAFDNLDEMGVLLKCQEEGAKLKRLGNIEKITADHNYAWSALPEWFQEAATESKLFHTAASFLTLARAGEMMRLRDSRGGKK
jgi:hypothetical protein